MATFALVNGFDHLPLNTALRNAVEDLGFSEPTPIQVEAFPIIRSGKNVVGVSQTGTGKTFAFMMPLLQDLKFSAQTPPRILIMVPTRELVIQLVDEVKKLSKYMSVRVLGVYGGANINTQAQGVAQGADVLVATPGRLYDLALNGALKLKSIQKLVIDEVDVMLDLGFRFQLTNIFELLPESRQNIMFSATMTDEIEELIEDFFVNPEQITIALSGTPLETIEQVAYAVPNFYTKVNLLSHLLQDRDQWRKVLVFTSSKKEADLLYEKLEPEHASRLAIIHSNKSQNARIQAITNFDQGQSSALIATDIIARGLDLDQVSHVVNFDCPRFPENYIHRIGRTGRAGQEGHSILFYREEEEEAKEAIETLMDMKLPMIEIPEDVERSTRLLPSEKPDFSLNKHHERNKKLALGSKGPGFHEKKEKNQKVNLGGSYHRELAKKYKKPQKRGDKIQNMKKKRK